MTEGDPSEKHSAERKTAAKSLRSVRSLERALGERVYIYSGDGGMYMEELRGLENLFAYVRTLSSRIVLDAGAGTLNGIDDLSRSEFGKGLEFHATFLHRPEGMKESNVLKLHRTSIEEFKGIPDASVGCIIGNYSIAYSEPALAVASIDRVLIPGGVLKATFAKKDDTQERFDVSFKETAAFAEHLRKLGYDVMEEPHLPGRGLILAIKPGGAGGISASELYARDAESEDMQKYAIQTQKRDDESGAFF